MKKLYTLTVLFLGFLFANAQTNVSGGIYANTTWTKINSPYIVTDTVVVFPGVTLTIEPGVVVKFADNKRLEIRQAKLVAIGTALDSITFTSNSGSPHAGSWGEVWLHNEPPGTYRFSYCNFNYAFNAIYDDNNVSHDTIVVSNSNFGFNNSGIWVYAQRVFLDSCTFRNNIGNGVLGSVRGGASNCAFFYNNKGFEGHINTLKNCNVQFNQTGVAIGGNSFDSILNCYIANNQIGLLGNNNTIINCIIDSNSVVGIQFQQSGNDIINCKIRHNGIGISDGGVAYVNTITENEIENNNIGMQMGYGYTGTTISCNKLCNNTTYDLDCSMAFGSNINIANNYWCSLDSATIAGKIHDGYDNINLGLAHFMPIDSAQCFTSHCTSHFNLYPDTAVLHHYFAMNMASGAGSLSYVWSWGDGTYDSTAYPSHVYAQAGFYNICLSITDSLGCNSSYCHNFSLYRTTDDMVYVNVVPNSATGISDFGLRTSDFGLYPNPASNSVTITIDETMLGSNLTVYDITGKKMTAVQLRSSVFGLPTTDFSSGVYFVTLENENGRTTKKLIIEK